MPLPLSLALTHAVCACVPASVPRGARPRRMDWNTCLNVAYGIRLWQTMESLDAAAGAREGPQRSRQVQRPTINRILH
jgi:hypothetical protein